MENIKVALIGFGTIGVGVAKILLEKKELLSRHTGRNVELARIVDLDTTTDRGIKLPKGILSDDLDALLADDSIDTVVQLVGGTGAALDIIQKILASGKNVVTANKALIASHGSTIFDCARKNGKTIAFEAAVAGGVPLISTIGQSLTANLTLSLDAILNGTCNFILAEMEEKGVPYEDVVAEAQRLGYAEADPTLDVNGTDAAQKLSILAHLAFGANVEWQDIPRTGVDIVTIDDIQFAEKLGFGVRLIATAERSERGLELCVSPTLVRKGTSMADVKGAFNAISILGDSVGPVFLQGYGAGQAPTASAVVADLVDTLVGRTRITFDALELFSSKRKPQVETAPPRDAQSRFYLRFQVNDTPGVLSKIAGVLGKHNISISSVLQEEKEAVRVNGCIPLVIMTHSSKAGDVSDALEQLASTDNICNAGIVMRVRE